METKNKNELAQILGLSAEELLKLESSIPRHYRNVFLKEKGRLITPPSKTLRKVQRTILRKILNYEFPVYVQGGVAGRSIVSNALLHRRKLWVACLDIKKFFPSVHLSKVEKVFRSLNIPESTSTTLVHLTTYKFELPQGAPTSPVLGNLVLSNFDKRISNLCAKKGITYSRYFDDITISGNRRLDSVSKKIFKIASQEGFKMHVNEKKFKIMPHNKIQKVTGIVVNGTRLKMPEEFIAELETKIEDIRKGIPPANLNSFLETIRGTIAFLKSVDPGKAKILEHKIEITNWNKFNLENPI